MHFYQLLVINELQLWQNAISNREGMNRLLECTELYVTIERSKSIVMSNKGGEQNEHRTKFKTKFKTKLDGSWSDGSECNAMRQRYKLWKLNATFANNQCNFSTHLSRPFSHHFQLMNLLMFLLFFFFCNLPRKKSFTKNSLQIICVEEQMK